MPIIKLAGRSSALLVMCLLGAMLASAQTTTFSYQGRLNDNSVPANGSYDLQFKLFDALAGGNQLETTQTREDVQVTNGIFTVTLDFTEKPFSGADVWLEIAVRPGASVGAFTTLAPRQKFAATPYAIRSLLATTAASVECQGCLSGAQIGSLPGNLLTGSVAGNLISGTIPVASVPAGSGNYIQNSAVAQPASNFNISGFGTANIFNAATQFNLGGQRVLVAGPGNLFVGIGAGQANTDFGNTFVGNDAGAANTTGSSNAFFGYQAGAGNIAGSINSFFGRNAGQFNTSGSANSFFGASAGTLNTTGSLNSFFGSSAGLNNTTGGSNVFVGYRAGKSNTIAGSNVFVGAEAGENNIDGNNNSFLGASAGQANTLGSANSFFGSGAGRNNTLGSSNSFFGLDSGAATTQGQRNSFFGESAGRNNTSGGNNVFVGKDAGTANTTGANNTLLGVSSNVGSANLTFATAIGSEAVVATSNTLVLGRSGGQDTVNAPGRIVVGTLGAAGATALCRNASEQISTCSSSRRYKDNIQTFSAGLKLVSQLRPVTFDWKADRQHDVGFVAEEVAALEPLLATYNDKGEVEGVKYAQLNVVLINAVKEQQAQIVAQQQQIEQLQVVVQRLQQRLPANPRKRQGKRQVAKQ